MKTYKIICLIQNLKFVNPSSPPANAKPCPLQFSYNPSQSLNDFAYILSLSPFIRNVPIALMNPYNSSKFMNIFSLSRRPFSSSAQSAHIADEKIHSSTEPLSGFFRRVLCGEERNERNFAVAENSEEMRSLRDRLRNLEEEVRNLNLKKEGCETVKSLELLSKKSGPLVAPKMEKRSLSALFTPEKKGQSNSKPVSKSTLKSESESTSKLELKSKSESKKTPERTAYGVEDPMVYKELSPDMKMFAGHLHSKGYLKNANFMPRDNTFDATCFEVSYAREFLRFAASKFGKDHPDIAGWLSAGDLKKVALFGCPSLGQRTVYAAKHMRKFFMIDEQKVCQACTLKGLCMFSNKPIAKAPAKLDLANVIKVLIMYSMESVPRKLVVPEEIKSSVSRLLKEIVSLSQDTSDASPAISSSA